MEYETSIENKLIEYGNTVASKRRKAYGAKEWYLEEHGVEMPHALKMIVDSSWGTSSEILWTAKELQIKVVHLTKCVAHLEAYKDGIDSILENGPESTLEEPAKTETQSVVPEAWKPTELQLKQMATDGRIKN